MGRFFFILIWLFFSSLFAQPIGSQKEIIDRIKPIGKVSVENNKQPVETVEKKVSKILSGEKTYQQFCIVCHKDGLAGAPKFQDQNDWKLRLIGKSIDDLCISATKGLNAMPAKGTCYECSDEALKAAIQYMLPRS